MATPIDPKSQSGEPRDGRHGGRPSNHETWRVGLRPDHLEPPSAQRPSTGTCLRTTDLPSYWLDTLSTDEKHAWDLHFQECASCRAAQADYEKLFDQMKIQKPEPVPADLAPRVLAQIPASAWIRSPRKQRFRMAWRPILKIAALLAILAGFAIRGEKFIQRIRLGRAIVSQPIVPTRTHAQNRLKNAADSRPALRRSLDWLQTAQAPDGQWDAQTWGAQPQFGIGVSALALLALIHKEPQVFQGPYAENVRHGIAYLIGAMNEEGLMGPDFSGATYNQGLATLALLEAQSRENHPNWEAASDRAVQWLIKAQNPNGGWGYTAGDTPNSSATVWPLQALIRAEGDGLTGTRPAVERGLDWLAQAVTASGELAYNAPQPSPGTPATLTAAGAVCFLLQNHDTAHPMARRLMATLRRLAPGGQAGTEPNYYRQYFVSKAFELADDADSLQRLAAGNNRWQTCQVITGPQAGSWEAVDPWGSIGGRVYSTALASLSLQTPATEGGPTSIGR